MKSKTVEGKYAKIYFRIFPMESMVWDYVKILEDHKTVYIRCLQELAKSKEDVIPTFWTFQSDHVFYNNSQQEVYDCATSDVLDNISQGRDAIIMAYGQTGTGKSLTISGLHNPFEDRGILPRIIPNLFQMMRASTTKNMKMCLQVSFVEISRTTVVDLLQPYPNLCSSLKDIAKIKVKSENDIFKHIFRGEGRKEFAENSSYPSHCSSSIFTFYITTKNREMQKNALTLCKLQLHVIDLAGADTVGNFSCLFKDAQEIGSGNLAKTQLEQFFLVLSTNIPEHIKVKYRLNPMIQYLGSSLSNASAIRLIGHIRVSREDLLVTISMLRFGALIGGVKATKYEINVDNKKYVDKDKAFYLQKELERLKMENKYNSILMHQDLSKTLNEERVAHVQRTIIEFLENKITELTLLNVCEVNIALEIIKMMYKKCEEENIKEVATTRPRKLSASSTGSKLHQKSSHGSQKSSNDPLTKRSTEQRLYLQKSRSSNVNLKPIKGSSSMKLRPKTSSSSLARRSTLSKRRSTSSASIKNKETRGSEVLLMPEIVPEYKEAWTLYIAEKGEDYTSFLEAYENNELCAKTAYKMYLTEINKLRQIMSDVEKCKNNLILAKMTREFQHLDERDEDGELILSEFQKCCLEDLSKAEGEKTEQQELVLKCQAELRAYLNACKQVRGDVKDHFEEFCKEKYQMPVENLVGDEVIMNVEEVLMEEAAKEAADPVKPPENTEITRFERFKLLIDNEKKKKELYKMKNREWVWN